MTDKKTVAIIGLVIVSVTLSIAVYVLNERVNSQPDPTAPYANILYLQDVTYVGNMTCPNSGNPFIFKMTATIVYKLSHPVDVQVDYQMDTATMVEQRYTVQGSSSLFIQGDFTRYASNYPCNSLGVNISLRWC